MVFFKDIGSSVKLAILFGSCRKAIWRPWAQKPNSWIDRTDSNGWFIALLWRLCPPSVKVITPQSLFPLFLNFRFVVLMQKTQPHCQSSCLLSIHPPVVALLSQHRNSWHFVMSFVAWRQPLSLSTVEWVTFLSCNLTKDRLATEGLDPGADSLRQLSVMEWRAALFPLKLCLPNALPSMGFSCHTSSTKLNGELNKECNYEKTGSIEIDS